MASAPPPAASAVVDTQTLSGTQRITAFWPTVDVDSFILAFRGSVTNATATQYWWRQNTAGYFRVPYSTLGTKIAAIDTNGTAFINTSNSGTVTANQTYNMITIIDRTASNASQSMFDGVIRSNSANTSTFQIPMGVFSLFSASDTAQSSPVTGTVDFIWAVRNVGAITLADLDAALFSGTGGTHVHLGSTGVAAGITPDYYLAGDTAKWNSGTGVVGSGTVTGTFV